MESLLFALNAVAPLVLIAALGYLLKRIGILTGGLAVSLNKLVFRLFLPILLFWNLYNCDDLGTLNGGYILYGCIAVLVLFILGYGMCLLVTGDRTRRGALWQASFRSNYALIGIPLATALFAEGGAAVASLFSAFSIPLFNTLAVVCLSVFRPTRGEDAPKNRRAAILARAREIGRGVLTNPLIWGVAAGLAALGIRHMLTRWGISFRLSDIGPVYKAVGDLAKVATPLALLALGAQFEFSAIGAMKKELIAGVTMRTVAAPLLGLGVALLLRGVLGLSGAHFAAYVGLFATPVAVSSVPMTQEMGGDGKLAGQLVVWTTIVSAISIFACSALLKHIGIF